MPKKKKKGKAKKGKAEPLPPPPPPPRIAVWPHGAVPQWQLPLVELPTSAVPAAALAPTPSPPDAKLCFDRFRTQPVNAKPDLMDDVSAVASELSGRKALKSVVGAAYHAIRSLSGSSMREQLGRHGLPTKGNTTELRARLGAFNAANALKRIARAEGVDAVKIHRANVGDTDGDLVDTETLEALTTLLVNERELRKVNAAKAAEKKVEDTIAAVGASSYLVSDSIRRRSMSPAKSSSPSKPRSLSSMRAASPDRRRIDRYTFTDSLANRSSPSAGPWRSEMNASGVHGNKYIREAGHQTLAYDDVRPNPRSLSLSLALSLIVERQRISANLSLSLLLADADR